MSGMRFFLPACLLLLAGLAPLHAHDAPHDQRLPVIGAAPDFTLTSQDGLPVSLRDFSGRVVAVAFIFVSCTDVCPMLTDNMARVKDRLGAAFGPDVAFVSITVDPEHDTPARLAPYVARFHPRLVGLTGTPAEIARVLEAYRIRSVRRRDDPQSPAGYTIDHPARIYVMDGDGGFRTLLNPAAGVDAVTASLKSLL